MALLINNDDTRQVLPYDMDGMGDILAALEQSYREEGLGRAVNRTKSAIHMPTSRTDEWHRLTTFAGGARHLQVSAMRIKTEIVYTYAAHGGLNFERYTKQRGTFGNFVLLFSAEDGQLLAILNDGSIQSPRVGASAGIAAPHMARSDARVVGILGSGGTAKAHALAYAHTVAYLERFQVYSPNPEHRAAFAEWITQTTGLPADAVDSEEAALRGVDIAASCTNDISRPKITVDSVHPGLHFTVVEGGLTELDPAVLPSVQRLVAYSSGAMDNHFTMPLEERPPHLGGSSQRAKALLRSIPERHTLPDVLLGRAPGRESEEEINFFISEGTAVQFATMASLVYDRCRERGLGRELDPEWFLQPIRT